MVALTEACKQAEGKTTHIHTDSRYVFSVNHDFGKIWKNRGFMTSLGAPAKNDDSTECSPVTWTGCDFENESSWKKYLQKKVKVMIWLTELPQIHSLGHNGVDKILYRFVGKRWNPGVRKLAEAVVVNYSIFMENSTKGRVKVQTR
jgi:hypothetical protein